jgi:hypothetical protein
MRRSYREDQVVPFDSAESAVSTEADRHPTVRSMYYAALIMPLRESKMRKTQPTPRSMQRVYVNVWKQVLL